MESVDVFPPIRDAVRVGMVLLFIMVAREIGRVTFGMVADDLVRGRRSVMVN